jgi:hypothetical protein
MPTISELEQQVRDRINEPRKHHSLFQDKIVWNKLCSCLDALGDTEMALDSLSAVRE